MKGLIRPQISRLPFKRQASIQRDARGIKAARVAENGSIYNQNHKSHSSAQPAAASSPCLHRGGTRDALNQLLFEGFLSRRERGVSGSTGRPRRVQARRVPPLSGGGWEAVSLAGGRRSRPVEGERQPGENYRSAVLISYPPPHPHPPPPYTSQTGIRRVWK